MSKGKGIYLILNWNSDGDIYVNIQLNHFISGFFRLKFVVIFLKSHLLNA